MDQHHHDPKKTVRSRQDKHLPDDSYRVLVEHARDVIFSLDPEGRFEALNPAFTTVTGWPVEAWLGRRFDELVVAEDRVAVEAEFVNALRRGPDRLVDLRLRRPDGLLVFVEVTVRAVPEIDPVESIIGIARDISERRLVEHRLRNSEERARVLVEHSPEAIVVTDVDTELFIEANPRAEALFGLPRERLLELGPADMSPANQPEGPSEEVIVPLLRAALAGEVATFEWIHRNAAGEEIPCEVQLVRLPDPHRQLVYGSIRDIRGRRRLQQRLVHVQKMEAVARLAGGIAHDFNNLLQAILGLSEVMEARAAADEPLGDFRRGIRQHVERGAAMVRQLLLFARREAPRPAKLDLNEVVDGALALARRLVPASASLDVETTAAELLVEGDRRQLEQALLNLVVNAAEAMPGGGCITIRTARVDDERAALEVADHGHGIGPSVRSHLFEPFFTTRGVEHNGLGLAVVHGIVGEHHGAVEVESTVGKGTTFRVLLPLAGSGAFPGVASEAATEDGSGPAQPADRETAIRVLLVEDEPAARAGLTEMLALAGYEVAAAADGAEARHLAATQPFNLLLSDVMLPDASGTELAAELRAVHPGLRLILMSGYPKEELLDDAAAGRAHFLQKPFAFAALTHAIRTALADD